MSFLGLVIWFSKVRSFLFFLVCTSLCSLINWLPYMGYIGILYQARQGLSFCTSQLSLCTILHRKTSLYFIEIIMYPSLLIIELSSWMHTIFITCTFGPRLKRVIWHRGMIFDIVKVWKISILCRHNKLSPPQLPQLLQLLKLRTQTTSSCPGAWLCHYWDRESCTIKGTFLCQGHVM